MEDCPAHNTRNSSIQREDTIKLHDHNGRDLIKISNASKEPLLYSPRGGKLMPSAFTASTTEKEKDKDKATQLDQSKINKLKNRARRLSEPCHQTTPKKSVKNKHAKEIPSGKNNSTGNIRRYFNIFEAEINRKSNNMATVSEIISEAHSTLDSQNTEVQKESTSPSHCIDMEPFNEENKMSRIVRELKYNSSATTTLQPIQRDHHDLQVQQGSQHSDDTEVSFKTNSTSVNLEGLSNPEQGKKPETPDFESLSNVDMIKLLITTLNQHKQDTMESMEKTLNVHKNQIMEQMKSYDDKVSALEINIQESCNEVSRQCKDESAVRNKEIEELKSQVQCLTKVVAKQGNLLQEIHNREDDSDLRNMKNNLIVYGITERKPERCVEVATNFFTNIMKINEPIQIQYAHRLGKGNQRPLLIHLKTTSEKGKIYKHSKNLKDLKNENNKKYKIRDQLPGKFASREARHRDLLWQNQKKKSTADHLQMNLNKGVLQVNNVTYKKLVEAPDTSKILLADKTDIDRWLKVKTVPGNTILKGKCRFQAYSVIASKVETVRDAYNKLRYKHADARHIVCGFRFPGRSFHVLSDFEDDQEHGMGQTILRLLVDADIYNRAIFVLRFYGGEHLGPARYQAYLDAAQSAILHDPYNHISKENQTPWPKNQGLTQQTGQPDVQTQANQEEQPGQKTNSVPTSASGTDTQQHQQCIAPANLDLPTPIGVRDRLPSGPTKPNTYMHNKHAPDPQWNNYYQQHQSQSSWFDQTNSAAALGDITNGISSLTQNLQPC